MVSNAATPSVRRPRTSPEREREFLDAGLTVLRDVGYGALTMDAVAALAKCSKATLYRLWQNKAELVVAALYAARPAVPRLIDTGTLRGDLVEFIHSVGARMQLDAPLFAGLAHAILRDDTLALALSDSLMLRGENVDTFVERAVERGELPSAPAAAEYVSPMFFAMMFSRPMFDGKFADEDYMIRFVDDALLPALRNS